MKFIIRKTSDHYNGNKPIKEAKKVRVVNIDRRTCKSFGEVLKQDWGEHWFSDGKNHRVENGEVARDMVYEDKDDERNFSWEIKISTLKGTIDLVNKYGQIIINPIDDVKNYEYEIEIYNDYRE